MIPVTYDWDTFKQYAEHCHVGSYQITETETGDKEIHVQAGKFGFIAIYDAENIHHLTDIIKFCEFQGFIKIEQNIREEDFYQ